MRGKNAVNVVLGLVSLVLASILIGMYLTVRLMSPDPEQLPLCVLVPTPTPTTQMPVGSPTPIPITMRNILVTETTTTLDVVVYPFEVKMVLGMGPVAIRGTTLPGGERASLVVLLPAENEPVKYSVGLATGSYWLLTHSSSGSPIEVRTVLKLIQERVLGLKRYPFFAKDVDVLIVPPNE